MRRGAYKVELQLRKIAPLYKISDKESILELWRGPTCAFKDMALQLLPYLLSVSASKTLKDTKIVILVATSGDTGKAALEGFKDVDNTQILVFYPVDGVSPMQKLQMTTQEGNNVSVCAIKAISMMHKAELSLYLQIRKLRRNLQKTISRFHRLTQLTGAGLFLR